MKIWFAIRMALRAIFDNKKRSVLTMLGVTIGVAAVIMVVGIVQSAMGAITNQIESTGSNAIMGMIMSVSSSRRLTLEDCEKMEKSSQYIEKVSPYILTNLTVKYGTESKTSRILGADEDYMELEGLEVDVGRNFKSQDIEENTKVAIVGQSIINDLFDGKKKGVVGEYIKINGNKFTVIGVIKSVANGASGTNDDMVVIPITTAQRTLKITSVSMFMAKSTSEDNVDLALQKIKDYLQNIFRDDARYVVFTSEVITSVMGNVTNIMLTILGGLTAISLIVGGIGIMNIMLVSVSERTREIGIRKAIGAKKKDIMLQILIECLVLTSLGGLIGIGIGLLVIKYIVGGAMPNLTPVYSQEWCIGAFTFSTIVGLIFGLSPANKAANLNPIEALRNE